MKWARCPKPIDDHTIAELKACSPMGDLNMPFEKTPDGPVPIDASGAVVVAGAVVAGLRVETPLGVVPALRFTFTADGLKFTVPIIQLFDGEQGARAFAELVYRNVEAAIEACATAPRPTGEDN